MPPARNQILRLRNGIGRLQVRRPALACGICVMRRDEAEVSRLPEVGLCSTIASWATSRRWPCPAC